MALILTVPVSQHCGAALATARAHISDLDSKIAAFELVLEALRDERNIFQKQLDAYTYPVDTLPNEIISEIFVNFIPPYPNAPPMGGIFSPVVLGQICRRWREIAFSTPSLWRAIKIDFEQATALDEQADLLETWLLRSKDCPLSISLQSEYTLPDSTIATGFLRAILHHCARWDHITLVLPEADLRLIEGTMPLLRNLTFGPTGYPDEEPPTPLTLFDGAPKLCAIELGYNFAPWSTRLPWSQLTTLTARALFEYECISILQQAPALVHFQTTFCDSSSDQAARAEAEDIPPLRHLMSLVLCGNICPDDTHKHMLEKLTLPELRTLEISELWLGTNADPCAIILSFIAKSRCTLDKLRITDARTPELAYREVFPSIPEISLSR